VLDEPGSFRSKEVSKSSALEYILTGNLYPDRYKEFYHKVRIEYYPPRGDAKEGWDNIDIFGWLGYPMQIKVKFPVAAIRFWRPPWCWISFYSWIWRSARACAASKEWLSFISRPPCMPPEVYPEHDIFIQLMKLKNTLRWMRGEDLITHLGLEYYD